MKIFLLTSVSGKGHSLVILFVGMTFALLMCVALYAGGMDPIRALRDARLGTGAEAGLISNVGIVMMAIAAVATGLCFLRRARLPIAVLCLFCGLFAVDDALLIHERFGDLEVLFLAFYGGMAFLAFGLFWMSQDQPPWPLAVAIGALAFSAVVDVSWGDLVNALNKPADVKNTILQFGFIVEDIPKFGAIFVITSLAIGEAVSGMRDPGLRTSRY